MVVVSHGIMKEGAVPVREIDRERKREVESDFTRYTVRLEPQ